MKFLAPCIWQNVSRRPILVLITVLVSCGSALAQEYPLQYREYEFSGFAGGSFIPESHFSTPVFGSNQETSRNVEMQYNTGFMFGARVTQNSGENWAGDLEYTLAIQRLNINNLSPTIPNLSFNTFIHHLSYNVLYLPRTRQKRFRPYLSAGAGVAGYVPSHDNGNSVEQALGIQDNRTSLGFNIHDSWAFLGNVGGGFKYLAREGFSFTVDVKDHINTVPSYGFPDAAIVVNGRFRPGIDTHGVVHNVQFNIGFTFQWDEFDP